MNPVIRWKELAIVVALGALMSGCDPVGRYDLIVHNARIWTGDGELREAQALAVHDGKFAFVGSEDELRKIMGREYPSHQHGQYVGINTQSIDAHGARALPGLIDSHLHLVSGGLQLSRIQLRDVANREAFVAAVAERAKKTPKGQWILGGRWSTERSEERRVGKEGRSR